MYPWFVVRFIAWDGCNNVLTDVRVYGRCDSQTQHVDGTPVAGLRIVVVLPRYGKYILCNHSVVV